MILLIIDSYHLIIRMFVYFFVHSDDSGYGLVVVMEWWILQNIHKWLSSSRCIADFDYVTSHYF